MQTGRTVLFFVVSLIVMAVVATTLQRSMSWKYAGPLTAVSWLISAMLLGGVDRWLDKREFARRNRSGA